LYAVDNFDEVVDLDDVPQSDVGAPLPIVLADDDRLIVEYRVSTRDSAWHGTSTKIASVTSTGDTAAVIRFTRPYAHMFGPPNDEALHGHPLANRGLKPYSAFEIRNSSWIRGLERMNSVHAYHDATHFYNGRRHFVFAFHDSMFECVASGYRVTLHHGSLVESVEAVLRYFSEAPV
jgi:hypothetical protein